MEDEVEVDEDEADAESLPGVVVSRASSGSDDVFDGWVVVADVSVGEEEDDDEEDETEVVVEEDGAER